MEDENIEARTDNNSGGGCLFGLVALVGISFFFWNNGFNSL
jgi:hypothetical protein